MWFSCSEKQSSEEKPVWEVRECTYYEHLGKISKFDGRFPAATAKVHVLSFGESTGSKRCEQENIGFTEANAPKVKRLI